MVPVEIAKRKGTVVFAIDEHLRGDVTAEQLAKMEPAFKGDDSVTAGNASGVNDGAAALVLATGDAVEARGLKPMARLVSCAQAGVDPKLMGLGPIPASRLAFKRAGGTVLPRVWSSVSVYPTELDADPMRGWLDSLVKCLTTCWCCPRTTSAFAGCTRASTCRPASGRVRCNIFATHQEARRAANAAGVPCVRGISQPG